MWTVLFNPRFDDWLIEQDEELQDKILADLGKLKVYDPELPRTYADTIKGSRYKNIKEFRVQHAGHPIRAFYAFAPSDEPLFYVPMIRVTTNDFTTNWCVSLKKSSLRILTTWRTKNENVR